MAMRFTVHPSFPAKRAFFTESGFLWKLQVREWAFSQVILEGITDAATAVTSNNFKVIADERDIAERAMKGTKDASGKKMTVKFFARQVGGAYVQPFIGNPWTAAEDLRLQVEVLSRRAPKESELSMTNLRGKTVALNAPDARAYTMDTTLTFNPDTSNPASHFVPVPAGVNHVVVSSHGGVPTAADKTDVTKICLFVSGFTTAARRIDVDNANAAFSVLKGKVAPNCVLWFGGCTIGQNVKFCQIAADASGCTVVAPVMVLPFKQFPKGQIDILDGFAVPHIFLPRTGTAPADPMSVSDFCAKQEACKFDVPQRTRRDASPRAV